VIADPRDFCDACIINSPRRCADHREPTYEVQAGQGHRIIARGLSKEQAEAMRYAFDVGAARRGLNVPPTWIAQDGWGP